MSWLPHVLGLDNPSGAWYLWWSGVGSRFVPNIGVALGAVAFWRHRNCHESGCWRLQHHPLETCRKHKPKPKPASS